MNSSERDPLSAIAVNIPVAKTQDRLSRLFAEHYRRVLMAAYRITGNIADAEDVAQTVFLHLGAEEDTKEIRAVSNPSSYLYRAAINGALDLLRRRKRAALEPLELASGERSTGAGSAPESEVEDMELGRQLRQAIGELAPRAAEMFALRYLEELSNREIAKLMGTSSAVVTVTLYQARSRLKKRLTELNRRRDETQ
jgi:RNA polymerase sigma factor (sigma-70 family)